MTPSTRNQGRLGSVLVLVALVVAAAAAWLALRGGPEPTIVVATDHPAIGRTATVTATFSTSGRGLGALRLELEQEGRVEVLAARAAAGPSALPAILGGGGEASAILEASVGTEAMPWLAEGEAVLRAVAVPAAGFLRRPQPVVVERRLAVRVRPPRLELASSQHYARQGGSGVVVYRVGDTVARSGVRAGGFEAAGSPLPGGATDTRFVLYAIPWNLSDSSQVRLFAEDDAGNRSERPFLDLFKPLAPRADTIELSDQFLASVVPAIAGQTPGFDASGSLLEQYLRINGELRRQELARVAELARTSRPAFLWSGPFLQMPNTALKANFAQTRSYVYAGQQVDRQTHLGLDLASTARAPVPAPNSGIVLFAGWMSLYGNAVIIDHGYGLISLCGHLSTVEVAAGAQVARGQIVATSGATGLAGGDHLHLEIFVHGQSVDPLEWLDAKWITDNIGSKIALP